MCSVELEPCEVWSETAHVSRRQRRCHGCGAVIEAGEAYLANFTIFEREASREAGCFACWATREQFVAAHGQSFAPSMLSEQLRECIDDSDDADEWRALLDALLLRNRAARAADRNTEVTHGQ